MLHVKHHAHSVPNTIGLIVQMLRYVVLEEWWIADTGVIRGNSHRAFCFGCRQGTGTKPIFHQMRRHLGMVISMSSPIATSGPTSFICIYMVLYA